MTHPTRTRIVEAATASFSPNGYAAVGIKRVVERANATLGSIYHFFPNGKDELCAEVVRTAGASYGELIELIIDPAADLATGLELFFYGAADELEKSDFANACPIATIAMEAAGTSEPVRQAAAEVFTQWLSALSQRLEAAGVQKETAEALASFCVSTLEGAFMLCRTFRDASHMRLAGKLVADTLAIHVPSRVEAKGTSIAGRSSAAPHAV